MVVLLLLLATFFLVFLSLFPVSSSSSSSSAASAVGDTPTTTVSSGGTAGTSSTAAGVRFNGQRQQQQQQQRQSSPRLFTLDGPAITVTLRDDHVIKQKKIRREQSLYNYYSAYLKNAAASSSNNSNNQEEEGDSNDDGNSNNNGQQYRPWIDDLSSLRPSIRWTMFSNRRPFPKLFPACESIQGTIGYNSNELTYIPSTVETSGSFRIPSIPNIALLNNGESELYLHNSYNVKSKRMQLRFQLNRGASYIMTCFGGVIGNKQQQQQQQAEQTTRRLSWQKQRRTSNGGSSNNGAGGRGNGGDGDGIVVEAIRGSLLWNIQSSSTSSTQQQKEPGRRMRTTRQPPSLQSVRISPSINTCNGGEMACTVEALSSSGRTNTILHLEYNKPTLAIQYRIDDRNIVSPVICLYTAKIIYSWRYFFTNSGAIHNRHQRLATADHYQRHNHYHLGGPALTTTTTTGDTIANDVDVLNVGSIVPTPAAMVETRIDPTRSIDIKWIDPSITDNGGCWITHLKLPLEGKTPQALAAELSVKRQFRF